MRTLPFILLFAACTGAPTAPAEPATPATPVDRAAFNQAAAALALPVFKKTDGTVVELYGHLPSPEDLDAAIARVEQYAREPDPVVGTSPEDTARREAVLAELAAGRPTLIETDLNGASDADKAFVRHMIRAARVIDKLYANQTGAVHLRSQIAEDDAASRALFERNQGPWCQTADCAAIHPAPPRISGLYPAGIQSDPNFCETLAAEHPETLQPFVVAVAGEGGAIEAVPYSKHWSKELSHLSSELRSAADAVDPATEGPLHAYLLAAAKAAATNDGYAADAAWAAMDQRNSRWYVRVGPDEVYFDPCGAHAGFHLQLARVNPDGLAWQDRLDPVKQDMEQAIAKMAGPPYKARTVGFDLPEFIDVILNAGDARNARGATVGQSLPNWGPVSDAGGRTVAMTNIGIDPDSIAAEALSMDALWCPDTRPRWPSEPDAQLASTVLHEAAHNLGPSGEYRVDGQTDIQRFGGPLASMLEELKAQTAAMTLTTWLAAQGVTEPESVHRSHMGDLGWVMRQIASGMFDPAGLPQPYPQLAAVQLGSLIDAGAVTWKADAKAANGTDVGCFEVDAEALPAAVDALGRKVFGIKARGDKAAAEKLRDAYTGPDGDFAALRATIAERVKRQPKASYVYRIILDD